MDAATDLLTHLTDECDRLRRIRTAHHERVMQGLIATPCADLPSRPSPATRTYAAADIQEVLMLLRAAAEGAGDVLRPVIERAAVLLREPST